jgi:hypothetical protein
LDKDTIVRAESSGDGKTMNIVRIPNPKNEAEEFSFTFNGVYDMDTSQEELFTNEGMRSGTITIKRTDQKQLRRTLSLFSKALMLRFLHTELRELGKPIP